MSIIGIALLLGASISYAIYMNTRRLAVDPASYEPLLGLIAHAESKGNYNAYFGNPTNQSIKFTDMTIADVQAWQQEFVAQGAASSAVGRYQFIDTTLAELVAELGIKPQEKFNQALQDKLAIALLERRGSEQLVNNELTREEFAANLAMEWASLPKVIGNNPDASYYDGDGLNSSLVTRAQTLQAVAKITSEP